MRPAQSSRRVVAFALLAAFASLALSACSSDFDPGDVADKLDFFHLNEKKKLPGERKELFPGGVPGVQQGIPQDLVKGYQPPSTAAVEEPQTPPTAPQAQQEKPKPKPHVAHRAPPKKKPTQVQVTPQPQQTQQQQQAQQQQVWPDPKPQQPQAQQQTGTQSPWPSQPQQQQTSPWPAAPPPNTFQH